MQYSEFYIPWPRSPRQVVQKPAVLADLVKTNVNLKYRSVGEKTQFMIEKGY